MLYEKVKAAARKKGIAISEIERKCHLSRGSICKWNEINPAFDKVVSVAKCLGVPISEFVETKEDFHE